jgi:tetratricopeptide (TPR) repeat protein
MVLRYRVVVLIIAILASTIAHASQDASLLLYRDAFEQLLKGDYTAAATKFETLLSTFPDSYKAPDAAYNLGYCLEKLRNESEAFDQYTSLINNYPNSFAAMKARHKAVYLAKQLRREPGDKYDAYLSSLMQAANEESRRRTAIHMAEIGNWSGLDLLLEGLKEGSDFQKIRISELLRVKINVPEVKAALREAARDSKLPMVRINSLSSLISDLNQEATRDVFIEAMLNDPAGFIRTSSLSTLSRLMDDEEVAEAFEKSLAHEKDTMVLQTAATLAIRNKNSERYVSVITDRLAEEQNPMAKYILTSLLRPVIDKNEHTMVVVRNLAESPDALVRGSALRVLSERSNDPQIKILFVNKLQHDPDENVRMIALNALGDHIEEEQVLEAVVETMTEAESPGLVTISLRTLRPHAHEPIVRTQLLRTLKTVKEPFIAGQVAFVLAPQIRVREVKDTIIEVLQEPRDINLKIALTDAISSSTEGAVVIAEDLKELYLSETNVNLANRYYTVIAQVDPQSANTLKIEKARLHPDKKVHEKKDNP